MRFTYTDHARKMMIQELDAAWVERTIREPEATEPDPDPDLVRAFRTVPERDGRVLRVVYAAGEGSCRIVIVFLDRGRRRTR